MFNQNLDATGLILITLGVGFILLTLLALRLMPRFRSLTRFPPPPPPANLNIASHNEAVLLVQSGGRVTYINQQGREMFNLWEEEPNLESLARRTRPSEAFLTLCATEGQARFFLNGRSVEGISYFTAITNGGGERGGTRQSSALLVSLRRPQLVTVRPIEADLELGDDRLAADSSDHDLAALGQTDISGQAFSIFTEFSQTIAASLELETTLNAILNSVERLIPSDFLEITLWDAENQFLVPYRLVGMIGVDRRLEKGTERYQANMGYSGYLMSTHKPLLVKDVNLFRQVRPALDRQQYPFQSFVGIPILVAGEFLGTLELASLSKENYAQNDVDILLLLSGQAGVALKNALLYQQEQQRITELTGLANLAQAVSVIRDPQDLYTHLVESITPLVDAEILGFLVYDEQRRVLKGQIPFHGIPTNVIEWYQTTIHPGSPAEAIWLSGETIISTNAPEDERLQAMELHHLALTASIRHNALAPLTTGGRMLGYLQMANKRDGTAIDQNDLRLLSIIAGQAAPIIENATLVQESRRRAQRAETLRRIASLVGSSATVDEVLKFSLLDMARLLQVDVAAIFLLDESRGELHIHKPSTFGIGPEMIDLIGRLPIDDPQFPLTVTGSKQQFISDDLSEAEDMAVFNQLPIYKPLVEELAIRSAVDIPLVVRERGIGELMVGSFRPYFFSQGDIQTAATAAGQLAAAIEQAALYSQTDQSLRQRVEQLTALTRISRELNTTLLLEPLLQRVYDEVIRTTRADCGTILLFDVGESGMVDREHPEVASEMQSASHRISLHIGDTPGGEDGISDKLHPLEQLVLEQGESVIIEDFRPTPAVGADDGDEVNGERSEEREHLSEGLQESEPIMAPAHEGIRSALIVPIAYQGQIAGLIHLHARAPNRFGTTEREISEALAIQAAIALGNAQRYQEQKGRSELLNRRVETLSKLFEVSQVLQTELPLEHALEAIAYAIQASTPFDVVLISLFQPETNQLLRIIGTGIPLATMAELRARPQQWNNIQQLLQDKFRLGRTYFIPSDQTSVFPEDLHVVVLSQSGPTDQAYAWDPQDTLFMPLFDSENNPLGLISVDSPRNNLRPDRPTIETLEIFGSQASLIIESHQKVHTLRSQVEEMQSELELAEASARKAQQHLPNLLHKDLEQTLAIQMLVHRAKRIHAGLDIIETVSHQGTRPDVLRTLGNETLTHMEFDFVLVAETTPGGLELSHTLGNIPAGVNPKALLGQRNPLRHCLQSGELLLTSNLDEDTDWQNAPLLRALEARSFICIPVGGEPSSVGGPASTGEAAILAISRLQLAPFTDGDRQLYTLLARQITVALQNIKLLDETTRRLQEVNLLLDFSRQLGSLDPTSIIQTLVETALSVVPSAQGAMVALWDPQQNLLVPQVAFGYANDQELLSVTYQPGEGIPGQIFEQRRPARIDEIDFTKHYNLSSKNLMQYRNATAGRLPVSSIAVPIIAGVLQVEDTEQETDEELPQVASQASGKQRTSEARLSQSEARAFPLGVLVLDNAQTTAAFSEDDLAVVTSLAQQTALTLENARLYLASEQRSGQLQALTDVATTVTSSLQPQELIDTLLDQLQAILPYDTGTLWLRQIETPGFATAALTRTAVSKTDRLIVQAARGFEDSDQRIGLTVDVQDSALMNEMISTGKPIWVGNVLEDPRFGALSLQAVAEAEDLELPFEPAAAFRYLSWLGVPLIASGGVIGVIALEKAEANSYTPDDIQLATTFAGQAAVGLENAKLYQESVTRAQELDQHSQTLTILNRLSSELSSSLDAERILETSIHEFAQTIPCSSVTVLTFESIEFSGDLSDILAAEAPVPDDDQGEQRTFGEQTAFGEQTTSDESVPSQAMLTNVRLQAEYSTLPLEENAQFQKGSLLPDTPLMQRLRESGGIFSTDDVSQEAELQPLKEFLAHHNTHSLMIVPIASGGTSGEEVIHEQVFHGLLMAHNDQPYHYHSEEFELARTISNQIAIALQNARLFEETRSLTEDLELRVQQRTAELMREQHRVETLLRIITELSASLDLGQVLQGTLQMLSEYVDAKQITILIARPEENKLHRLASYGYPAEIQSEGTVTSLEPNQGLAGWIISQRQSVLLEDVLEDERWVKLSYSDREWKTSPQHRSAMGVPLMSGAEALGCLLLFHPEVGHFSLDQLDLVQAAANQVAVAVNNAELYRLIRDQAEDLGTMLRSQQIETSRSQAILEAVADGVLVTDASRQITLFNESAENILGLDRSQVLNKSLEQFTGLFGRAAKRWMGTITIWSQDATTYQAGETYLERITLEDGKVISVHLAPVILRNDFLGTVSIFQDITHQVEVDRLKSEFVATVSHELRTPMTSIKGYVEILLMGAAGELGEQQQHFLQIVKSNTERLAVLVNDLLDVSQIESGRVTLQMQPMRLEETMELVIADLMRRSKEDQRPVTIDTHFQPNLPRVLADADRIRQILDNLLDNAYQYNSPNGKITVRVHQVDDVDEEHPEDEERPKVQIDISDTGIGIHPDDLPRVFERFFRGENPLVLGVSGTGLGLSIVHYLVELHNGRIWVESTGIPGEGSTFSFTLPIYKVDKELSANEGDKTKTARRKPASKQAQAK